MKNNSAPVLNFNNLLLDLFKDLKVDQLQGFIVTKNCQNLEEVKSYFSKSCIKNFQRKEL